MEREVSQVLGELWDNRLVLELDPHHHQELSFALLKAVGMSGLSLSEISARLEKEYVVMLSISGVSHAISRGDFQYTYSTDRSRPSVPEGFILV